MYRLPRGMLKFLLHMNGGLFMIHIHLDRRQDEPHRGQRNQR